MFSCLIYDQTILRLRQQRQKHKSLMELAMIQQNCAFLLVVFLPTLCLIMFWKKAKQMPYQRTLLWRIRKTVYNLYYFVHKCHWWLWKYVLPTRVSIAVWIFYTNAFSYLLISITYHRTYQCWPTFAIIPEIQNVTILRET